MSRPYCDKRCADCRALTKYGYRGCQILKSCGLTKAEHRQLEKLRKQADQEAHQLVFQAKAEAIRPQAIVKAFYDEAEQAAKRRKP